jgi:hypothetical protein
MIYSRGNTSINSDEQLTNGPDQSITVADVSITSTIPARPVGNGSHYDVMASRGSKGVYQGRAYGIIDFHVDESDKYERRLRYLESILTRV